MTALDALIERAKKDMRRRDLAAGLLRGADRECRRLADDVPDLVAAIESQRDLLREIVEAYDHPDQRAVLRPLREAIGKARTAAGVAKMPPSTTEKG